MSALVASFKPVRSRFGPQPARDLLRDRRLSIRDVAAALNVRPDHLANALRGAVTPRPEVRERMPQLLGVPLEELFTPEAIALPFHCYVPERQPQPGGNGASDR